MDEEVTLIDTRTRNEKIKNFIIKNKKKLISVLLIIIILILGFYSYQIFRDNHKQKLSEKYNSAVIEYGKGNKSEISTIMKDIIEEKDSSYSPLALYFIIELDDTLKPDWDEIRIDDEIGINIHDYIMTGNEDICVEVVSGDFDVELLIQSNDKVYIQREQNMVNIYWRRDASYYEQITFKVSGSCSAAFLSDIDQF